MDIEHFRNYCISKPNVEESFPFDEHTLVFKVMGKIFAIVGLDSEEFSANLKCDPERSVLLRDEFPDHIYPGYHMNKLHWNTVKIDSGLRDSILIELIDHSYALVLGNIPRKIKDSYVS
jgi:predicted DNA-binding protein (MmcQ/YjbR family)